jgi:molecular chaperone DnaJ
MAQKDYYRILGVRRDADLETIKRAYRELAKKYHPDKTSGHVEHTERFKEVSEAYQVLSDEKKRAAHDRELAAREAPRQRGFYSESLRRYDPFEEAFAIFRSLFAPPRSQRFGTMPAEELALELTLTPLEARGGSEVEVDLPHRACPYCGGRGVRYGAGCPICRGSGRPPAMSVRIPIPRGLVSGEMRSYRFTTPYGAPVVVHVTYTVREH